MEPRIQYAKTADGVSIAFWTLGEGRPVVYLPMLISHIQIEWQWPEWRSWYERIGQRRKLVRFDGRGTGLSDRDVSSYSLDARLLDVEAVVSRLELQQFTLIGQAFSGPTAIAYAARHPERVSQLVLMNTWARGADYFRLPQVQAQYALIAKDWNFYVESTGRFVAGWESDELGSRYAAFIRQAAAPRPLRSAIGAAAKFDTTTLLPHVNSPTLVVHVREVPYPSLDVARSLASQIPDARLALLEGTWMVPGKALRVILEFLDEGEEAPQAQATSSGLVTILFTDIESSTTLTQRLGDARAQELLRAHNTIVRDALKTHGGGEIKHTGDGIMASFSSASRAIECAIAIQRGIAARAEEHPETPLRVRIGLNAGEPVAEDQDLFGTAVQLAARICAQAEPGQILIPDGVRHLIAGKGFLFSDHGDVALRGFEDPVRLYEVRWQD